MDVEILFTGIAVSDFGVSQSWYKRFFARRADVVAHETEVMWQVTERGWLYIVRDAAHAGSSQAALAVSDIEEATSALESRGEPSYRSGLPALRPSGGPLSGRAAGKADRPILETAPRPHRRQT